MPAKSQAQRALLNAKFGHEWVKRHHFDNKGKLPKHKAQEAIVAELVEVLLHHGAPMPCRPGNTDDQCWQNYRDLVGAGELQTQQPPPQPPRRKRRRYRPITYRPPDDESWLKQAEWAEDQRLGKLTNVSRIVSVLLGGTPS